MARSITWCLAALAMAVYAGAEPTDVYLLSGQSNMQGSGQLADLTEAERASIPTALYWNGEAFEPLTPGKTKLSANLERFGPELPFARRVAEEKKGETFYVIKYAASGRPLDRGLDGANWCGEAAGPGRSTFYPGETPDDPNVGAHYQALRKTMKAALAQLKAQGVEYRVAGFLWMQGEADAKQEVSAKRYAQSLRQLHERLMADLSLPDSPMVYGQVLPYSPPAERFTHRDEMRQSQANLDHASGHAEAYPSAYMVSTDGIPLNDDTVHYSSRGLIELGDRFYSALKTALSEAASTQAPSK